MRINIPSRRTRASEDLSRIIFALNAIERSDPVRKRDQLAFRRFELADGLKREALLTGYQEEELENAL